MSPAKDWIPYYIETYMYLLCIETIRLKINFFYLQIIHLIFSKII